MDTKARGETIFTGLFSTAYELVGQRLGFYAETLHQTRQAALTDSEPSVVEVLIDSNWPGTWKDGVVGKFVELKK